MLKLSWNTLSSALRTEEIFLLLCLEKHFSFTTSLIILLKGSKWICSRLGDQMAEKECVKFSSWGWLDFCLLQTLQGHVSVCTCGESDVRKWCLSPYPCKLCSSLTWNCLNLWDGWNKTLNLLPCFMCNSLVLALPKCYYNCQILDKQNSKRMVFFSKIVLTTWTESRACTSGLQLSCAYHIIEYRDKSNENLLLNRFPKNLAGQVTLK